MKSSGLSKPQNLRERTFQFSVQVVKLCQHLDQKPGVARTLGRQLLRAATSVGANLEEALAAQSRADFISKNAIALKEARETHYWLRLLAAAEVLPAAHTAPFRSEVEQLMRILGAIILSAKKSNYR